MPNKDFYVISEDKSYTSIRKNVYISFSRALKAVRSSGSMLNKSIVFLPGRHFILNPVVLKPADSGISITSAEKDSVSLFGGIPVEGWKKDGKNWYLQLPPSGIWNFRSIIVNGKMVFASRYPLKGTFKHLNEFNIPWMSTTEGGWKRKPTKEELTKMKYRKTDLQDINLQDAEITVYHQWDASRTGIAEVDTESSILFFASPLIHPAGAFGVRRYVLWNVKESLFPGCWYFNRRQLRLYYRPLNEEDMTTAQTIIPTAESLIVSKGDNKHRVKDISIKNLSISATGDSLMRGEFGTRNYSAAINFKFAEGLSLKNISIANISGYGIRAENSSKIHIENCIISKTGAGGIIITGGEYPIIKKNHIFNTGLIYPSSIALFCGSKNALIRSNNIHHTSYSGIICTGDGSIIEENFISDVMQELRDGGAIYIGRCENVAIRNNLVRNIRSTRVILAHGYYLDEQSKKCRVENNIALDVDWPLHNHMASNNVISNNFLKNRGRIYISFPRCKNISMEKNALLAGDGIVISGPVGANIWNNNVFYSKGGKYLQIFQTSDGYKETRRSKSLPEGIISGHPFKFLKKKGMLYFQPDNLRRSLGINNLKFHFLDFSQSYANMESEVCGNKIFLSFKDIHTQEE
jgi:parallel beta-helix repeat protein